MVVWGMVAMAAVSAVGAVVSSRGASAQNANQAAWNRYNAQMSYNTSMNNIQSQTMIGMFNASMAQRAGEIEAERALQTAGYNAEMIAATTAYNNSLLEEETRLLWEAEGLDQTLLARERAVERGDLLALQSVSGTTVGFGSNKDAIIDQMAQEAMDSLVIRHNADRQAAVILNATAQNTWQGDMQIQRTIWEGQTGAYISRVNAANQAQGIAVSTLLSEQAGRRTARYQLSAGMTGANMAAGQNQFQINQNLTQGLFSAAAMGVQGYYGGKTVGRESLLTDPGSTGTVDTGGNIAGTP